MGIPNGEDESQMLLYLKRACNLLDTGNYSAANAISKGLAAKAWSKLHQLESSHWTQVPMSIRELFSHASVITVCCLGRMNYLELGYKVREYVC